MLLGLCYFLNGQVTNPSQFVRNPFDLVSNSGTNQTQLINKSPMISIDQILPIESAIETTTKDTTIVAIIFRNFKDFKKSGFNFKRS